jgi:hypothetical protein
MAAEQVLQGAGTGLANREGIIEAAPAALLLRLHTQYWQRADGLARAQRIAEFEERIPSTPQGRVGRGTKGSKPG